MIIGLDPSPAVLMGLSSAAPRQEECSAVAETSLNSWKNGNRHPGWGVAEIQKMSPPTTGRHAAAVLSNKGVPQFWEM